MTEIEILKEIIIAQTLKQKEKSVPEIFALPEDRDTSKTPRFLEAAIGDSEFLYINLTGIDRLITHGWWYSNPFSSGDCGPSGGVNKIHRKASIDDIRAIPNNVTNVLLRRINETQRNNYENLKEKYGFRSDNTCPF